MQILIVEDEPKIAQLLRRGLLEDNYAVDVAADGQSGFDKFSVNEYDLVILDRMLPKLDGLSVCREMRNINTNIPIIMLTAKGETEDKISGLDSGADDYVTKPFVFGELTARIRALLRRGSISTPTILSLADLTLDPARREVTRGGVLLQLTAREYALLEYLLRNQNISLSKTQILEHVWDYNYDGLSNIVETYVKYLRKKLQTTSTSVPLIHTIRGYGYAMKAEGS